MRQSGKQDSFRHKLKSSISMYESPGLQFLGTTTGIQSGPDIFDEWRFIMIFLTILRVAEILCFRLVPEDKIDKGILESSILQFFEKFLANNFSLSDSEDNTSRLLNRGGIADFPFLENTISNSPKVPRTKFLGSDGIFCFISVCKFGSFQNPFATITILSEIYFRFRRFILLEQIILWAMAATQAAENHGNEWGLTWHLRWGIYTSISTWTYSQNSVAAAEALSLTMIRKTVPISTKIVISYTIKRNYVLLSCHVRVSEQIYTL